MSADILHPGHINCLNWLERYKGGKNFIIIGLLSDKAVKGYKTLYMDYKSRKTLLESLRMSSILEVVKQDSLDPSKNIEKYRPEAMASGDGWEKVELGAIKKFKLLKININLPKEYSSSAIKRKICESL